MEKFLTSYTISAKVDLKDLSWNPLLNEIIERLTTHVVFVYKMSLS